MFSTDRGRAWRHSSREDILALMECAFEVRWRGRWTKKHTRRCQAVVGTEVREGAERLWRV